MTSPRQRAANRANSRKSTGPRSDDGKVRVSLNATKQGLSLPVSKRLFAQEIEQIVRLIQSDCDSATQAEELAKRIVDFERNEAFLNDFDEAAYHEEVKALGSDPGRLILFKLLKANEAKQAVDVTFTQPQKNWPVKLSGKQRTEEIKFIESFLRLDSNAILNKVTAHKHSQVSALRYQKRAINQLVKGIKTVANGEEF